MTNIRYYSHLDHSSFLSGRVLTPKQNIAPSCPSYFFVQCCFILAKKAQTVTSHFLRCHCEPLGAFKARQSIMNSRVIVQTVFKSVASPNAYSQTVFKSVASPNAYSRCFLVIFRCLAAMAMPAIIFK